MSRISIIGSFCCFALCCAPAFSQTGTLDSSDQKFIDMAAQTDMTEAHFGQMAENQASAQGVKDYAQMLVTDHTNDYQQLSMTANKAGGTVPKGLDAAHEKMVVPFHSLKGSAFDRRFIHEMVAGHEQAIAAYKREANDGQNADLKAYANQALPTLEKHLQNARDLEKNKGAK